MSAREQAESLRQQAIATLLDKRGQIEEALKRLGWGEENGEQAKKRGRPPKEKAPAEAGAEVTPLSAV